MKNVEISFDKKIMTVKVDLSKEFGKSKSGKTTIIASTEGNQKLDVEGGEVVLGLNCYKK